MLSLRANFSRFTNFTHMCGLSLHSNISNTHSITQNRKKHHIEKKDNNSSNNNDIPTIFRDFYAKLVCILDFRDSIH